MNDETLSVKVREKSYLNFRQFGLVQVPTDFFLLSYQRKKYKREKQYYLEIHHVRVSHP